MMDMHFSLCSYDDYINTPIIFSYTYYFKKTMKLCIALFLIIALFINPIAADILANAPANPSLYPNQLNPNNPATWPQQSSTNPVYTNPLLSASATTSTAYPYAITCPPGQLICAGACSPYYPCLT